MVSLSSGCAGVQSAFTKATFISIYFISLAMMVDNFFENDQLFPPTSLYFLGF